MKVIQKGTGQTGWSRECKCTGTGNGGGGCGAVLLVEQPDLYLTHRYDYTGDHDQYVTFACSECKVETDVQGVPRVITSTLPDKNNRGKQDNGPK